MYIHIYIVCLAPVSIWVKELKLLQLDQKGLRVGKHGSYRIKSWNHCGAVTCVAEVGLGQLETSVCASSQQLPGLP